MTISRRSALQMSSAALAGMALFPTVRPALAYSNEEMAVAGPLGDKTMGNPEAPVTIVEYASLTCPHCASFHTKILPEIKTSHIDSGKAHYIYRDFPLDGRALGAAMLAHCAPEERYFAVIDLLFEQQGKWSLSDGKAAEQALLAIMKQAGFTQEKFYACLQNRELLDGVQWVKRRASTRFGVGSTPTVFVNGELSRARNAEELAKEIDDAS